MPKVVLETSSITARMPLISCAKFSYSGLLGNSGRRCEPSAEIVTRALHRSKMLCRPCAEAQLAMSKIQYVAESGLSRCGDAFFSTYSGGKLSVFCSLQAEKYCDEPEAGACDDGCEERIVEAKISDSS